jgi:hypothetical protein
MRSERPRRRRWNVLAGVGVFAGIGWAIMQLIYSSLAVSQDRQALLDCGVEASKAALSGVTAAVCVTALLALAFAVWRRPALALSTIGIEAVLVVVWIAMEGARAAGCAIE